MAVISEGATLQFNGETLGEVISISFSGSRGTIETSHLGTEGGKTFLAAKLYEGEISVECYADPANATVHADVEAYLAAATPTQGGGAALVFTLGSSAGSYTCTGIPTGIETSVGLEAAATTTYSFKLTSTIVAA